MFAMPNQGLNPVLNEIENKGCPLCREIPVAIEINGPDEILLRGCGHVVNAEEWADARYEA